MPCTIRNRTSCITKSITIDIDSSVVNVEGHQEGAVKGYNPKKPGNRCYNTQFAFCDEIKAYVGHLGSTIVDRALLVSLLEASCPILRMSAVYALGRNPDLQAVTPLLALLQNDSNGYVRKAVAWSLSSYPDAPVMNPLIRALQTDIAAVRLWAASSLADAGSTGLAKADQAAGQLLQALRIDSEAAVRSNSAWSLGRLYGDLVEPRQLEVVESLLGAMLHDADLAVRDEARLALEQLEDPLVLERLQTLVNEGLLS